MRSRHEGIAWPPSLRCNFAFLKSAALPHFCRQLSSQQFAHLRSNTRGMLVSSSSPSAYAETRYNTLLFALMCSALSLRRSAATWGNIPVRFMQPDVI